MDSDKLKSCCASVCTVVSAVAVPVLIYIPLLCGAGSRLIEIPQERKTSAAVGCWVAAALYEATNFFYECIPIGTLRHFSFHITSKPGKHSKVRIYERTVTSSTKFPLNSKSKRVFRKYMTLYLLLVYSKISLAKKGLNPYLLVKMTFLFPLYF